MAAANHETGATQPLGSTNPDPSRLNLPRVRYFGDYELIEEIARGGMGVVWKARQSSLNRAVAVKMILAGKFAGEAELRRFYTEAQAAGNLQHPNIVPIHEVGEYEGHHYFSMDFVEGTTLAKVAQSKPMQPAAAASLMKTVAEAIHYAHQRGTLHRDLKPSNILIDAQGQPHITDFGLAKSLNKDASITETGAVLGTPAYMPPEQAAGRNEQVGPASDVYSLGAILYHLLTGSAPFLASSSTAILRKVIEEEPAPLSKARAGIPVDLETICSKCLEKNPGRRYHSARELAEELGRFLDHEPIQARPVGFTRQIWNWARHNPKSLAALGAAAAVLLFGFVDLLFEKVRFFQWQQHPVGEKPGRYLDFWFELAPIVGYCLLLPMIVYGRWLKDRGSRNKIISSTQLFILAGGGLIYLFLGLWCVMQLMHTYVWHNPFSWVTTAGLLLGSPLIFCWFGGLQIIQTVKLHHVSVFGSVLPEGHFLPRQPVHYSVNAFVTGLLLNLAMFWAFAKISSKWWYDPRDFKLNDEPPFGFLFPAFIIIATTVAFACWQWMTRKLNQINSSVTFLFWLLVAGAALVWFTAPGIRFVPAALVAGLLGGFIFKKVIKIRPVARENLPALRLQELFQWNSLKMGIGCAIALAAQAMITKLFFADLWGAFLVSAIANMAWPFLIYAIQHTREISKEFFKGLLVPLAIPSFALVVLIGRIGPRMYLAIPIGFVFGLFLLKWSEWKAKSLRTTPGWVAQ